MSTNLNDSTRSVDDIDTCNIKIIISTHDDGIDTQDGFDDSCNSGFDPISVASVVGDRVEFRRLQEDLRNSRMITGIGTQQVLNKYIESRRLVVEEKRQNDEELRKVKFLERPNKRMSSLRSFPVGNDAQEKGVIATFNRTLNRSVNSLRFDR
jgi:hypothetical protein